MSNPTGANFAIGSISAETITIVDNDAVTGATNPIDGTNFFVRQHYLDFLNRDPDPPGFTAWVNILNTCPAGVRLAIASKSRSAFFRSDEFLGRGYFIYRLYSASLGRFPTFNEFMSDKSRLSGFLTAAELEANKVAFVDAFMARPEFVAKYGSVTDPTAYVNLLESTAGVTLSNKAALITGLAEHDRDAGHAC